MSAQDDQAKHAEFPPFVDCWKCHTARVTNPLTGHVKRCSGCGDSEYNLMSEREAEEEGALIDEAGSN
jgi:Zn finger protein HypA/HybF involved in hydrogenase expression